MKTNNDKSISVLNDLIETLKDGQHGFKTAAEDAKDSELRSLFTQYAQQRTTYLSELQSLVTALGGKTEESGSISGSLHRGWINLKAAMSSNEPHAVLAEAERGEDVAVEAYRDALESDLDSASREVVARQYTGVQGAHDKVKQLRDSYQYSDKAR